MAFFNTKELSKVNEQFPNSFLPVIIIVTRLYERHLCTKNAAYLRTYVLKNDLKNDKFLRLRSLLDSFATNFAKTTFETRLDVARLHIATIKK